MGCFNMSKRLTGIKGQKTGNRSMRNNRHNNYMARLLNAGNEAKSESAIETIKKMAMQAKVRFNPNRLVPKGASKMLSSLVRQRG